MIHEHPERVPSLPLPRKFAYLLDCKPQLYGSWRRRLQHASKVRFRGFSNRSTPGADLVMTHSVDTMIKTLSGMRNPAKAIQSGEIQVSDFEALVTYGQLFPVC